MIVATVGVFGVLIFAGLLIISELVTNYETTQQTKCVLLGVGVVISIVLLSVFIRWVQDPWYWILEKDRLVGGRRKDKVFPLSSITTIVPGLPDKTNPLVAANKFVNPEIWTIVVTERKLALLLKFSDGSFMSFHVHRCVDGSRLMTELITRLAEHIDRHYEYTDQEIKALRSADWNRVVKQRIA